MLFTSFLLNSGNYFDVREKRLISIALAKLVGHSELVELVPEFWLGLFEKFVSIQSLQTQNVAVSSLEDDLLESGESTTALSSSASVHLKTVSNDLAFVLLPTLADPQVYMIDSFRRLASIKPNAIQILRGASPVAIEYLRLLSSKSGLPVV